MKCENVEVVATVIVQRGRLLALFNPRWGAFTFPMSRRKQFLDPTVSKAATPEKLERAAARVAAEVLGRSFAPGEFPRLLCEIKDFEQSDADGIWKLYHIQVFGLTLPSDDKPVPGLITEWFARDDFKKREPVTHTARFLLDRMEEAGHLPPWKR